MLYVYIGKLLKKKTFNFIKEKFLLFEQLENMNKVKKEILESNLKPHPFLKDYHKMTQMFSRLYRELYLTVDQRQTDVLTHNETYSDNLNTVIPIPRKYK